jgi:chromosome segregation ATPase
MTKIQENLNSQIEAATHKLTELEAEQAGLSQATADAANAADAPALIHLAHRRNNLPIEILASRITLEQLYQRRDEEKLPGLQTKAQELSAVIPELQAHVQSAQLKLNLAIGAQVDAGHNEKDVKQRVAERKREIEALLHQARNTRIVPNHLSVSGSN